jgi:hypothetical protein
MGHFLFGDRMSVFDVWAVGYITFIWGAGNITGLEAFGISCGTAVVSALLKTVFAGNSK